MASAPIEVRQDCPKRFKSTLSHITMQGSHIIWSIGASIIIKESPRDLTHETPFDERHILDFVQRRTTIPIGLVIDEKIEREGSNNPVHVMIRGMIQGVSLDRLDWSDISPDQRRRYADQTVDLIRQLRGLTEAYMGRLGKTPLVDMMLFNVNNPIPQGPFNTDDELWAAMAATLGPVGRFPQQALDKLRSQMPSCAPYTFTHGDLSQGNIIVRDGNVVGLIDFKWSGYFPVWWEYAKNRGGTPWNPNEWCQLLAERMDPHQDGWEFWSKFHSLARLTRSSHIPEGNCVLAELLGDDDDDRGVLLR